MKETIMNQEKLTQLPAQMHIGGKGTSHRKVVQTTTTADNKNFQFSLKKLKETAEALPEQSVDGKAPFAATGEEDEGEIPDLVENFDEASKNEAWLDAAVCYAYYPHNSSTLQPCLKTVELSAVDHTSAPPSRIPKQPRFNHTNKNQGLEPVALASLAAAHLLGMLVSMQVRCITPKTWGP
ncbi:Transcription factor BTF3 [Sciurus carolinensis]|uniref:Transcription factor BTF3 n=1 Tax=Sciurus carolinensis TaxID=30640 RepID=A0AA41SNV1_SCICA|nr:Transcription factor BTF3 [Sciurus carolinensis]